MVELPHLITDLALILVPAGVVTILFKKLRQPLVLGYIITGFLVGPNFSLFPTISEIENIEIWSEIGVIFLLFGLGLEFSFKKLVKVGGAASITALFKIGALLFMGYLVGVLLGWSQMDSIFLGGLLSISSTAITMRVFEEQGLKGQQFVGLSFGILVIEDLVAILLLVVLSTIAISREFAGGELLISLAKLSFFLVLCFVLGIFFLPTLLKKARKLMNDETLLIVALGLCLLMVFIASEAGFSPALGAFMMGSILAETTLAEKIEHIFKPVRDLFGAIFFVSVGMLIDPQMLVVYWAPVLIISLVTIVGKFFSSLGGALLAGQTLKTSVQTGMSLAQIGEFSFIIAALGLSLRVTSDFLYPVAVAVSVVTSLTTPYMIRYSEPVYVWMRRILPKKAVKNLSSYSSGAQGVRSASEWQQVLKTYFLNVGIFTTLTLAVILLSNRYLMPFMTEQFEGDRLGKILGEFITFIMMAPFLWALAFRQDKNKAARNLWLQRKFRGPLWVLRFSRIVMVVACIAFWLGSIFTHNVTLAMIPGALIVMVVFSGRIQKLYDRLESRFLSNYNQRDQEGNKEVIMDRTQLAPWDAHIADFEVDADFSHVGKTLAELALREKIGINIAMIRRGKHTLTAPTRYEKIFPGDKLYIIGTDKQVEKFRDFLRGEQSNNAASDENKEVVLRQLMIKEGSDLVNKSIRESGMREKTEGLIIGIERKGKRILNPESTFVFEEGDVIWIVGNKELIAELL